MGPRIPPYLLLLIIAFMLGAALMRPGHMLHNGGSLPAMRAILLPEAQTSIPVAQARLEAAARAGRAEADWTLSMLATHVGDEIVRQAAQSRLIETTPARLDLLRVAASDDQLLALQALERYPQSTESITWRAAQIAETDPQQAIALYQQALALDPIPYDWWLGLGRAYEQAGDDQSALAAYTMGCQMALGVIPCHEKRLLESKLRAR